MKTEISDFTFDIHLKTDAIVPFVWLNVQNVPGLFSDNGFIMVYDSVTISFYSRKNVSLKNISSNLNITHLMDVCTV